MNGQAIFLADLGEVVGVIWSERRLSQLQFMLRHQLIRANFHMPLPLKRVLLVIE